MVRTVLIKLTSVLLTVWYLMSIIGFDVHTCSGSGCSFVTTFIEGMTCAEVHPEHVCDAGSCCSEARDTQSHSRHSCHGECVNSHSDSHCSGGVELRAKSCCSNDYQVLHLTGTVSSEDSRHYDECSCGHCLCVEFPLSMVPKPSATSSLFSHIHKSDSGLIAHGDVQSLLNIWRI